MKGRLVKSLNPALEGKLTFKPTSRAQNGGNMQLDLSAPKVITFGIAVVIALIASIIHYAHISVPYITTGFTLLLVGFLILAAGNVFRGL